MSWRRISILTALMLSLGGAASFLHSNSLLPQAIAQNTEAQPRPEWGKTRLIQELNLTSAQTQQLQTIQNQYQAQIAPRQQAVRQARQELFELMAGTASQSQIQAKHRQVETLQQQAAEVRLNRLLAMREVLTPQQRRQFAERMQNRWQNHKNRGQGERQSYIGL